MNTYCIVLHDTVPYFTVRLSFVCYGSTWYRYYYIFMSRSICYRTYRIVTFIRYLQYRYRTVKIKMWVRQYSFDSFHSIQSTICYVRTHVEGNMKIYMYDSTVPYRTVPFFVLVWVRSGRLARRLLPIPRYRTMGVQYRTVVP